MNDCPRLDQATNLCTDYENRIGFTFQNVAKDGRTACSTCVPFRMLIARGGQLSPEIADQCCIVHPELLEEGKPPGG